MSSANYGDYSSSYEDDDGPDPGIYTLGSPAEALYNQQVGEREKVLWMARRMAELTDPAIMPPEDYEAGDDLAGNNQSVGSQCVANLASKLMFMAFPPGQPMARIEPVETKLQPDIDKDPQLYSSVQLALSRVEQSHRKRLETTPMRTAYVGLMNLLLVAGNGLWKQIDIESPTYHRPDCYVVQRDSGGHPLHTIHKERVKVMTLDEDIRSIIYAETPELLDKDDWLREADIYSVCKLKVGHNSGDKSWLYWQEYMGQLLPGTEMETDYEDCPEWPCWIIPVYGKNWGRSYCEKYRGDLYSIESLASAGNDGAALAAWALLFVKPGTRTSLKQVRDAKNLDILHGSAEDLTVFRSDKTADLNFAGSREQMAARRLAAAFLLQSSLQRDGERVTAEEISRLGVELDQGMGGLYTAVAQGNQRVIVRRFMFLHEEDNKDLPELPKGVVSVAVVTGVDALGRSTESTSLRSYVKTIREAFPTKSELILDAVDFARRLAAADGIKPDGLVRSPDDVAAEQEGMQQQAMQAEMLKGATPAIAKAGAETLVAQAAPQDQPAAP